MSRRNVKHIISLYKNKNKPDEELLRELYSSQKILSFIIQKEHFKNMLLFSYNSQDQSLKISKSEDGVSEYKHTIENNILFLSIEGYNIVSCIPSPINTTELLVPVVSIQEGVCGICFHSLNKERRALPDFSILIDIDFKKEEIQFEQLIVSAETKKFLKPSDSADSSSFRGVKVLPEIPLDRKPRKDRLQ